MDAVSFFHTRLHDWYTRNGRTFPWRETTDPYRVLIAELMLRRTQARQVEPVYRVFIAKFPDPAALATAEPAEVATTLYPLGLPWRALQFQKMAIQVVAQTGGTIPGDRHELLALAGVGDYVASAVRTVAFGEPGVLVDTNTVRVAGRYLGFPTHAESRRNRAVRAAIGTLIDPTRPREANLALLDFAALVCRAPRPQCGQCPMAAHCMWYNTYAEANQLPGGRDEDAARYTHGATGGEREHNCGTARSGAIPGAGPPDPTAG